MTSDRLSPDRERAIRERLAAITYGPWWCTEPAPGKPWFIQVGYEFSGKRSIISVPTRADARMLVAAPADVRALLAEIDALRAERAAAKDNTGD